MTYKNIEYNDEEPSEIESMRTENAALRAEVEKLKRVTHISIPTETMEQWCASEIRLATTKLRVKLTITQLEAKRLREALEYKHDAVESLMSWCVKNVNKWDFPQYDNLSYANTKMAEAISSPTSTEALDAYVAEKVKELQDELSAAYKSIDDNWTSHQKIVEANRQRDLAVSALKTCLPVYKSGLKCYYPNDQKIHEALTAVKESEV